MKPLSPFIPTLYIYKESLYLSLVVSCPREVTMRHQHVPTTISTRYMYEAITVVELIASCVRSSHIKP